MAKFGIKVIMYSYSLWFNMDMSCTSIHKSLLLFSENSDHLSKFDSLALSLELSESSSICVFWYIKSEFSKNRCKNLWMEVHDISMLNHGEYEYIMTTVIPNFALNLFFFSFIITIFQKKGCHPLKIIKNIKGIRLAHSCSRRSNFFHNIEFQSFQR